MLYVTVLTKVWSLFDQAQFEIISSEVSYLNSMNILVDHFMSNLCVTFDRDKESIISRDDFNRLFSNARAVRDASAKLVTRVLNMNITAVFFLIYSYIWISV